MLQIQFNTNGHRTSFVHKQSISTPLGQTIDFGPFNRFAIIWSSTEFSVCLIVYET